MIITVLIGDLILVSVFNLIETVAIIGIVVII